jgi:hypothetical protein
LTGFHRHIRVALLPIGKGNARAGRRAELRGFSKGTAGPRSRRRRKMRNAGRIAYRESEYEEEQ